jgi:hypothetical protein
VWRVCIEVQVRAGWSHEVRRKPRSACTDACTDRGGGASWSACMRSEVDVSAVRVAVRGGGGGCGWVCEEGVGVLGGVGACVGAEIELS